jgi:hypothetical protein
MRARRGLFFPSPFFFLGVVVTSKHRTRFFFSIFFLCFSLSCVFVCCLLTKYSFSSLFSYYHSIRLPTPGTVLWWWCCFSFGATKLCSPFLPHIRALCRHLATASARRGCLCVICGHVVSVCLRIGWGMGRGVMKVSVEEHM